jgi:4-amino-4-deoxychorismate lyase
MTYYSNGKYRLDGVLMDPSQPGFRYGAGFFETLYYNGRKVCHLPVHLDRIFHSMRDFGIEHEDVDFEAVITQVLNRNNLLGQPARVNIFYAMETPKAHPVILAAPFEPKPYKAYRLCLCTDRHVSTLNAHKTTSYMFFHLALKQARAKGFDDTVLLDFDNTLLEATTGALLFKREANFYELESPYRLDSTTLRLAKQVLDVVSAPVGLEDLPRFRHAYLLNSLIGMRPVVAIGETAFVPDEDACRPVTELVLEEEVL